MANQLRNERARYVNWGHPMTQNHLPPKSPSVSSVGAATCGGPYPGCVRVPNYAAGREHRRSPSASFVPDVEPSWLEDLLDSPKAPERRASHRRSASDSFAFLEAPSNLRRIEDIAEEDELLSRDSVDYDREEQLASMFAEMNPYQNGSLRNRAAALRSAMEGWTVEPRTQPKPYVANVSYGSSPLSGGKMATSIEAELYDYEGEQGKDGDAGPDQSSDQKRSKRQSAQRSRVRKLQYIAELEGNVSELQNEVSALSTQVALLEHQRLALHIDNATLKQNVAALAQERRLKDAHTEALRKEVQRLNYLQQQQQRFRQQLALAASATYNVETKHMRRASAGSVQDLGSASEVLDSFVKFVEKTDTPTGLPSSCTLAGNGKSLEVGRVAGAPPGFIVQNQ